MMSVGTILIFYFELSVIKTPWGLVPASGREVSCLERARLTKGNHNGGQNS